ncbi:hypothetical protein ACI1MP_33470 [Kitasatospora griseola]|uniref:hypothetical protein n=1 Tax=Kitasatospora griseola TaxID=2064 RepID=UPI003855791D
MGGSSDRARGVELVQSAQQAVHPEQSSATGAAPTTGATSSARALPKREFGRGVSAAPSGLPTPSVAVSTPATPGGAPSVRTRNTGVGVTSAPRSPPTRTSRSRSCPTPRCA